MLLLPGSVRAQEAAARAAAWPADSVAVVRASTAWMAALERGDAAALDTLMAEDFRLSSPAGAATGSGVGKDAWIRNSQTLIRTRSARYESIAVRPAGPDVAVSSGVMHWKARMKGWPIPSRYEVTDVWVRRDGRWQVAARDGDIARSFLMWTAGLLGAGLVALAWAVSALIGRRRRRRAALRKQDAAGDTPPDGSRRAAVGSAT